ncbi:Fungal Zn(2)-Cys(6) binuclear cluster domain-containing protein [Penicillium ucsense]|uniref:Fungal Zn(2)-Cys(6) binuclear cluster domain-containing protein n=1 Tax=Penicillium ucsense TaxID=2839758 RepID=A0A8J8W7I7_9EURO|nr:Fungal Zn(2)-Cys(6) binuclear cluster domain-containing protein [Penicillium ucsense]KAF7738647.1 Fungal Zn(2)-Cys(6) binuclear cluster domain-containing protein [Penicillium ucsense]
MASTSPQISTAAFPRAPPSKRPLAMTKEHADDENRRKDPKVSRACDNCKRKKVRCDGTLPCSKCAKRNLDCAYDAKYGRGRPPTPPISTTISDQARSSRADRLDGLSTWQHASPPTVPAAAEHNVSRASPDVELEGQYFDPTSGLNFLHRARKKLLIHDGLTDPYASNGAEKNQLLTSAGDRPFLHEDEDTENFIPNGPAAKNLVQFYFESCVVTYRIFHRQTVEVWLEAFLKDLEHERPVVRSLNNARTAIILTIMAIATLRMERVDTETSVGSETPIPQQSDRLFGAGMKLVDQETGFPRLESAQARLIQVLYLLQTSRINKGWYTLGTVFQISLSLGMHRRRDQKRDFPFTSRRHNYITSECYKRTFWSAYIIDEYLSVVFGRPRLYRDEDIDQDFPDQVNDEDMGDQGPSISDDPSDCYIDGLIYHAKIAQILGKVSREVYSVSDMSNYDRLAAAHRFARELHEWRTSLPAHLGTVKPSTLVPAFRRQAIALQLAYSHALIHTNRPFLLSDAAPENVSECISATRASLELVNRMAGDSTLFHSFWWTHYVIFCALAVVYVWEIQRVKRPVDGIDDGARDEIFELAEKCRAHLKRASASLAQNRRYSVILDEIRSEAQRCRLLNEQSSNAMQGSLDTGQTDPTTDGGSLSMRNPNAVESGLHMIGQSNVSFNMMDSFLISDWQTLDSSVFLPLPDPDSVSPTYFYPLP